MTTILDVRGTAVQEDDLIAVATSGYSHKPEIRVGQVLSFHARKSDEEGTLDQIEVFWHHVSNLGAQHLIGDTSRIDSRLKRFVVIGKAL